MVAANRDEFFGRPSLPPRIARVGELRVLAPRDEKSGGTWLGANERGLFAAVTNRRSGPADTEARSRGLLLRELLGSGGFAEAHDLLQGQYPRHSYNPFNLLLAGRDEAWLAQARGGGEPLDWIAVGRGIHLLTNEHDLDELVVEELECLLEDSPDLETIFSRLRRVLSDHTERRGHTLCKHLPHRGTRSSSIFALSEEGLGGSRFLFADGPPCRTEFRDGSQDLRALPFLPRVEVLQGDITELEVDAVVNAANSLGEMGGGVAGALRRKGGIEVEREAMERAPIPVGTAVVTTAGKLPCKKVIHAPTMERPAMATIPEKVRLAARAALETAEREGLASVAIPGLGTGVGRVSAEDSARAILEEVCAFRGRRLRRVILVDVDREMVEAFRGETQLREE